LSFCKTQVRTDFDTGHFTGFRPLINGSFGHPKQFRHLGYGHRLFHIGFPLEALVDFGIPWLPLELSVYVFLFISMYVACFYLDFHLI
jgi:hypothetical protein